jgi:hypothetical protein
MNNSLLSEESIKNLQNATSKYIHNLKEKNNVTPLANRIRKET